MFIKELYEKYREEFRSRLNDDMMTPQEYEEQFGPILETMDNVMIDEPSGKGIIYYRLAEEDDMRVCRIPVFGYYASSEKVLTRLFIQLSEKLVDTGTTNFQVHLYAHDAQALQLFSMMQFGYMAETGIIKHDLLLSDISKSYEIRTLDKAEILNRWDEIWKMTDALIAHLRQAPIFYPATEFSEEEYKSFFTDEDTRLHVAFDECGSIIGMIETNSESSIMIRADKRSVNIGEAYVVPEKRGCGLADALFLYALTYEKERGAEYLWVEHGTANPNARGFWNKYFTPYEYELIRRITEYKT